MKQFLINWREWHEKKKEGIGSIAGLITAAVAGAKVGSHIGIAVGGIKVGSEMDRA